MIVYRKIHWTPIFENLGTVPSSYLSRVEINLIIAGLKKAIRTVAAACIPNVSKNASTNSPRKKDIISISHPGKETGSNRIGKIYT